MLAGRGVDQLVNASSEHLLICGSTCDMMQARGDDHDEQLRAHARAVACLDAGSVPRPAAVARPAPRRPVTRTIVEHVTGRQDNKRAVLSLIVFELWHEKYIRPSRDRLRGEILCGDIDRRVEHA